MHHTTVEALYHTFIKKNFHKNGKNDPKKLIFLIFTEKKFRWYVIPLKKRESGQFLDLNPES